jgi:uncharacterized protein YqgC (DUF456 family)
MDVLLLIIGFICMLSGILGCFLPVLPGPGISWAGIALLYLTTAIPANYCILGITLVITIVISILDYVIPAKGTKRFGGSSYGIWGTNIGLIIGIQFLVCLLFLGLFISLVWQYKEAMF